jgi:endonuclease/exonuclease/phosphatase family metal-dependent hydrolase
MRVFKLVIICLYACLVQGCGSKSIDTPAPLVGGGGTTTDTTSDLRVMSYNIHHANPPAGNAIDINGIANIIKAQSPHLVALQEVDVYTTRSGTTLHQAAELGRITGMNFYFGKAINYAGGEYGVAILSKFPISGMKNTPLPTLAGTGGEPRTLASAVITLGNGKKVVFASTHLDAQANDTNRILQANKIIDILKLETVPVILAGDLNAVPGTKVINMFDSYFTRTCTSGCGFTIPATNATRTIDFITYVPSDKFTVLEHKVIPERLASDHLPVFSVLRIK